MGDGSTRRGWVDDPSTFAAALDDLEAEGCLLLVLEAGDADAGDAGCRRMLGDDAVPARKRLFVRDGADSHATAHDPAPGGTDQHAVVYRSTARGTETASTATPAVPTTSVSSGVDALGDAVADEADALAPLDGYEPGQLRVCVDGLATLLEDADLLTVLQFTRRLRETVRDHRGVAHVHVGQHVAPIAVEGLFPQFDAVVEVADSDAPRQRWHLPDESLSTEWLEL